MRVYCIHIFSEILKHDFSQTSSTRVKSNYFGIVFRFTCNEAYSNGFTRRYVNYYEKMLTEHGGSMPNSRLIKITKMSVTGLRGECCFLPWESILNLIILLRYNLLILEAFTILGD